MIAVVVVRDGVTPIGAIDAAAEAGGRVLVVGGGASASAAVFDGVASTIVAVEAGAFAPGAYAAGLAPLVASEDVIVLPGSPDGRDLGPRLAAVLDRPFVGNALYVRRNHVTVPRFEGRVQEVMEVSTPYVATLVPGGFSAASPADGAGATGRAQVRSATLGAAAAGSDRVADVVTDVVSDVVSAEVLPPDPSTMDLTEAPRIVAGGQGLGGKDLFDLLGRIGASLGASLGGTRVASDAGWIPFERQIGTTGVAVDPRLYLAFAISGATQHTSGLGAPEHVISVNLDGSCPMMAMADLAIVSDAREVLKELAIRLGA